MDNSEKLKALDAAISKIEKDFGKGAIMKLGDKSKNMDVETIPTGSLSLDLAPVSYTHLICSTTKVHCREP